MLGVVLALVTSLLVSMWRAPAPLQPELVIDQQEQISWPARTQMEINNGGESQPRLKVGAYVTNISDFDLLDDQFSIELLLWTLWDGAAEANPSDHLTLLNGIYEATSNAFRRCERSSDRRGPGFSTGFGLLW